MSCNTCIVRPSEPISFKAHICATDVKESAKICHSVDYDVHSGRANTTKAAV